MFTLKFNNKNDIMDAKFRLTEAADSLGIRLGNTQEKADKLLSAVCNTPNIDTLCGLAGNSIAAPHQQHQRLTRELLDNLKVTEKDTKVNVSNLADKTPRTLLYGYTIDRSTWHVYLGKDELFHLIIHSNPKRGVLLDHHSGIEFNAEELIPNKRVYPSACDLEFCKLIYNKGLTIPFTSVDTRKDEPYQGLTLEELLIPHASYAAFESKLNAFKEGYYKFLTWTCIESGSSTDFGFTNFQDIENELHTLDCEELSNCYKLANKTFTQNTKHLNEISKAMSENHQPNKSSMEGAVQFLNNLHKLIKNTDVELPISPIILKRRVLIYNNFYV